MNRNILSFAGTLVLAGALVFLTADTGQAAPRGGTAHFSGGHVSAGHISGGHFSVGHVSGARIGGGFTGGHFAGANLGAHRGGFNNGAFRGSTFQRPGFGNRNFGWNRFPNFGYRNFGWNNRRFSGFGTNGWFGYPSYSWSSYPSFSVNNYPSYSLSSYPYLDYSSSLYDYPYLGSSLDSLSSYPSLGFTGDASAVPDLGAAYGSYEAAEPPVANAAPARRSGPVEADRTALVTVTVPAGAGVWFEGVKMAGTGTVREFQSPPLASDRRFTYTVKASWEENGRPVTQTQTVRVFAGANVNVVFPTASTTTLPPPKPAS